MEYTAAPILYLRLRKRITIRPGESVTLGQAARLLQQVPAYEGLGQLVLYKHKTEDGNRYVIDILHIIHAVRQKYPELVIEPYGDPQVLIMITPKAREPRKIMLIFSWLLLFFWSRAGHYEFSCGCEHEGGSSAD